MMARSREPRDQRVLLVAPTREDAATTVALLRRAGLVVEVLEGFEAALDELSGDTAAAAFILPEEALSAGNREALAHVLEQQPPWSDLPLLILTRSGSDSGVLQDAVRTLGNVTLLERPLRVGTLVSAVRTAVRARQRQYQTRKILAEREQAEAALREADQRKDEFLATLGHELRNPLAPLLSGLHLLRLNTAPEPRLVRTMTIMERQIQHLVRLVDDLMEVSRITRGLVEVRHDTVDLLAVIREAVETTRPLMEAWHHVVSTHIPAAPIFVAGDGVRLTQIFANLLTNAAKYTNTGGRIDVTVMAAAGSVNVSVRDNGIGIPPQHLTTVFDMFMQVDRAKRQAQGGLGIGLTLVRSLVQMHGGTVQAHSAGPGAGTEFVVRLPMLQDVVVDGEHGPDLSAFPHRRVLVVDDNTDAAELLADLLHALGATVSVAHNGPAALELLDRFEPDAVLLDIGMPGMDGYEVARRVRAMGNHAGMLLIALTGWGQEQDVCQSKAAGFDHHLVKPPDIDTLRELLAR